MEKIVVLSGNSETIKKDIFNLMKFYFKKSYIVSFSEMEKISGFNIDLNDEGILIIKDVPSVKDFNAVFTLWKNHFRYHKISITIECQSDLAYSHDYYLIDCSD